MGRSIPKKTLTDIGQVAAGSRDLFSFSLPPKPLYALYLSFPEKVDLQSDGCLVIIFRKSQVLFSAYVQARTIGVWMAGYILKPTVACSIFTFPRWRHL